MLGVDCDALAGGGVCCALAGSRVSMSSALLMRRGRFDPPGLLLFSWSALLSLGHRSLRR